MMTSENQRRYYSRGPSEGLTPVAAEVLNLMFRGMTLREIASLRHRSPKTVEWTVAKLRDMTGTPNNHALIYEALSRGWITPPARYVP